MCLIYIKFELPNGYFGTNHLTIATIMEGLFSLRKQTIKQKKNSKYLFIYLNNALISSFANSTGVFHQNTIMKSFKFFYLIELKIYHEFHF